MSSVISDPVATMSEDAAVPEADIQLIDATDHDSAGPSPKRTRSTNTNTVTHDTAGTSTSSSPTRQHRFPLTKAHRQFRKDPSKYHLLVGVTGSVAAIKLPVLIEQLRSTCGTDRLQIRVVCTTAALHFIEVDNKLPEDVLVYVDEHEWSMWQARQDPVLHIDLRKWADSLLIAPLDANTLAKLANGLCDNLLTCITRAWEPCKPLHFAPAMNTYMYEHPLTYKHLDVLKGLLQYKEIPAVVKELMCGESGMGAMAEPRMIASIIQSEVKNRFSFVSYH